MSVLRLFIAIELSAEIQAELQQVAKTLKTRAGALPVRWVPVNNIHLTLVFLGDVVSSNLDTLKETLRREATGHRSFEITVAGLGAFPSMRKPRVVWIGVSAPSDLAALQHRIARATERLGYPAEDRPYSPHLTLGRVGKTASPEQVRQLGEMLEAEKVESLGDMQVRTVNIFSSALQPGGAVYTRLLSVPLST